MKNKILFLSVIILIIFLFKPKFSLAEGITNSQEEMGSFTQYQRLQAIETNGISIGLPRDINLWCGYRDTVLFKIENRTDQDKTVVIKAKTKVNIFLNGLTCEVDSEDIPIEVAEINVPALAAKEENIEIQSLRVGKYELKFIVDNKEINLTVNSKIKERGAYFMYRCWFEGSEFFTSIFSDGKEEITPRQMRGKRDAHKYKFVGYRKQPDWKQAYNRKKEQHTETYGFAYIDVDDFGWGVVETQRGRYDWTRSDFMLDLSNKYFYGEPFTRIEAGPGWIVNERGPSGRYGFYDAKNKVLMDAWEKFCETLAERYDGDGKEDAPGSPVVKHFILANEPDGAGGWFAVDFTEDGWPRAAPEIDGMPSMESTNWLKEAQQKGEEEIRNTFIQMFGDITFEMTKIAGESIKRANPKARVCTHQFCPGYIPMYLFEYMVQKGIGKYIDAWGIHPGNAFDMLSLWEKNPQVPWWYEDATNQAPSFQSEDLAQVRGALDRKGEILKTARPMEQIKRENPYMGKLWRHLIDEPFSHNLEEPLRLFSNYGLDIPFWVTEELTIGPLATNRRENLIAALREYSIVFHLKTEITVLAGMIIENMFAGSTKVNYLPDPIAKELIIDIGKAISGASPLEKFDCRWFNPKKGGYLDYRKTVYKLFNRGDEDIIALWSNSSKEEIMEFEINLGVNIRDIKIVEYDADEQEFRQEKALKEFPKELKVKPLKEFYFISVKSNKSKFEWLKDIRRKTKEEEISLFVLCDNTRIALNKVRDIIRKQKGKGKEKFRSIQATLEQGEDAIIMGYYAKAREKLESVQKFISDFKWQVQLKE